MQAAFRLSGRRKVVLAKALHAPNRGTTMITSPSDAMPTVVTITVGAVEAGLLAHTACAADPIFADSLEVRGTGGYLADADPRWGAGTLLWCDSTIEALVVCQYERACGYDATAVWDVCMAADCADPHAVLTSRPWPLPIT